MEQTITSAGVKDGNGDGYGYGDGDGYGSGYPEQEAELTFMAIPLLELREASLDAITVYAS